MSGMKSKFGREIGLLSLPFLFIAGAAIWKSRVPDSGAAPRVTVAPRGGNSVPANFRFGTATLHRMGPLASQNAWNDSDFSLQMPVDGQNLMIQPARVGQAPGARFQLRHSRSSLTLMQAVQMQPWQLSAAGQSFGPQSANGVGVTMMPVGTYSKPPFPFVTPAPPSKIRYSGAMRTAFDLDRVAPSLGPIDFGTWFSLPDGRIKSLKFTVRPQWFTWAAQGLALQNARWRAPKGDDDGSVEVTVRSTDVLPPQVRASASGSEITWRAMPSLDGKAAREVLGPPQLLHNWSPRLESADGKWNSHAARDVYGWVKYRARFSTRPGGAKTKSMSEELAAFRPKIVADAPVQRGHLTTIVYRFYGMRAAPQARVFKTEIGVSGDGFLKVSVNLGRGRTR